MNLLKHPGKIIFDPQPIKDSTNSMFKPFWIIVTIDDDLREYYSWFLKRRYRITVQRPAWGAHISVVRGEITTQENWEYWKNIYNNKNIEFEHELIPKTNGGHWWLKINCEELFELRTNMEYKKDPHWSFHLTLGMSVPQHQERTLYIMRLYEKGLLNLD